MSIDITDWAWANEPRDWSLDNGVLRIKTENITDYWRKTFYGFTRESGHFLYQSISGDFTCEVLLAATFGALYDQLGLMIRSDSQHWVKAGLEYSDGAVQISTVVTNQYSDWSVTKCDWYRGTLKVRITRHKEAIRVEYLDKDNCWILLRLAYLKMANSCSVGMMCCSPERMGFIGTFSEFEIREPIPSSLHQ